MKIWLLVGFILSAFVLSKVYAYKRFLRDSVLFTHHKKLLIALLGVVFLGEIGFFILAKEQNFNHLTYRVLGTFIVIGYCLFAACVIGDIARSVARIFSTKITKRTKILQSSQSSSPNTNQINQGRREFFKILLDLGIVVLFFVFTFKSYKNACNVPPIREVRIRLQGLKSPKTIAMISDVHIGKVLGESFLRGIVKKINALNADIVVIVGDLVDEAIDFVKQDLMVLNEIQSKEGVFYVSGNHEYYHGIDSILDFLENLNLKILHNQNIELEGFNLAGIDDLAGLRFKKYEPNLNLARKGLNSSKPSILLTHQPKFLKFYDVSDFDLVLCGHTHAGQVFPLSIFVWLDQKYIHGLYRLSQKTQLYVSSGAGFWGPTIRFLAPSEIVSLKIYPA
ncbi:metallophosphoesterase [uncultured Helicobacter sp.]|uniref:metallophosphoesterase n=1 Tax=uncultured Helicobacter sp. TaxID=175537 RepID=UPI0027DC303B|nr:metallophosphoesterase [uncultured Helicobacter sp.]